MPCSRDDLDLDPHAARLETMTCAVMHHTTSRIAPQSDDAIGSARPETSSLARSGIVTRRANAAPRNAPAKPKSAPRTVQAVE